MEGGVGVRWYDFRGAFDYLDDLQWNVFAALGYAIGSKLHVLAEYSFGQILYDELTDEEIQQFGAHSDLDIHLVTIGLRGPLTPKLDVMLKAGVTVQQVREDGDPGEMRSSFFGKARVAWSMTARLTLEVDYLRDVQISQAASYQLVDRGELRFKYWFSPAISVRIFGYVENTNPSPGRSFLRYGVGFHLEYRLTRWMAMGVGGEWRARDTEIPDASFRNLRGGVHVTFVF
jgi:hypothetical protein